MNLVVDPYARSLRADRSDLLRAGRLGGPLVTSWQAVGTDKHEKRRAELLGLHLSWYSSKTRLEHLAIIVVNSNTFSCFVQAPPPPALSLAEALFGEASKTACRFKWSQPSLPLAEELNKAIEHSRLLQLAEGMYRLGTMTGSGLWGGHELESEFGTSCIRRGGT